MTASYMPVRSQPLGKTASRKARAERRNAKRAVTNAATVASVLDPAQSVRAMIRARRLAVLERERQTAKRLLEPLKPPVPSLAVTALREQAEAQLRTAAALDAKADVELGKNASPHARRERTRARRERKLYLDEAKRLNMDAETVWQRQLEGHHQGLASRETDSQAKARGVQLEDYATDISGFIRDEYGALVPDEHGVPKLQTERVTVRRQKNGLDWLKTKGRITAEQARIGREAGAIWAGAAQAAEPGRAEETGFVTQACKASPGPADWRMSAMLRAKEMEVAITSFLPGEHGAAVVAACRSICYHGLTIQALSGDDRYEAIRLEERLKLGLALIRYWINCEPSRMRGAA